MKKTSGSLTEHAKPVVHGHHDHVAVGGQDAGIEHVSGAFHVGASMDKQHHRLLPAVTNIYTHTHKHRREWGKVNNCIYASHILFDHILCKIIIY